MLLLLLSKLLPLEVLPKTRKLILYKVLVDLADSCAGACSVDDGDREYYWDHEGS